MSTPQKEIAQRIRKAREYFGLSARAIADKYGVTAKSWLRWETGESAIPSTVIHFLHDEFGVSPNWLITGEGAIVLVPSYIDLVDSFNSYRRVFAASDTMENAIGSFVSAYNEGLIGKVSGLDKINSLLLVEALESVKNASFKPSDLPQNVVHDDFIHVPLHDVQGSCGDGAVIHSEQIVDYLAFKREWISRVATDPKRLALIEAAGDSMMPTISSGDLLLIDLCVTRVEQDAIYAINVEGMLYIKRIQKRLDGTVIVKSDNPAYEEQRFNTSEAEALRIVGRVIWMGKRV